MRHLEFMFKGKVESYRRMTRFSKHDASHQAYYAFKEALLLQAQAAGYRPDRMTICGMEVAVWLPMPKSWTKKKKDALRYRPHQQKPDADNLLKAFMDSLTSRDETVYEGRIQKQWCPLGQESAHVIIWVEER